MCTILSNQALRKGNICFLEIEIAYLIDKRFRTLAMFRKFLQKIKWEKISVLETLKVRGFGEEPAASRSKLVNGSQIHQHQKQE